MEDLLTLRPDELVSLKSFHLVEESDPRYRITIYERPRPGRIYGAGIDTALGISGKDRDAMIILDRETYPYRMVAIAVGHLGESFHKIVYALCRYYHSNVFIMAERAAMGLATMRTLRDLYGYTWMYYERMLDDVSKEPTTRLGYAKTKGASDPIVVSLRQALTAREILVPDEDVVDELSRCQFKARDSMERDESTDADMKIKLARGGSPDLMMALAYANTAVREVARFPQPEPVYKPGTLGDVLDHKEIKVKPAHREEQPKPANPLDRQKPRAVVSLGRGS